MAINHITFIIAGTEEDWLHNRGIKFNSPIIEFEICKDQLLKTESLFDMQLALSLGKGRVIPGGFVMQTMTGEILYNYFDLIKWIEKEGLRLI